MIILILKNLINFTKYFPIRFYQYLLSISVYNEIFDKITIMKLLYMLIYVLFYYIIYLFIVNKKRKKNIIYIAVIAGSEGVPDALQKCHSLSRDLQNNQTTIFTHLSDLKLQINNFTTQVNLYAF